MQCVHALTPFDTFGAICCLSMHMLRVLAHALKTLFKHIVGPVDEGAACVCCCSCLAWAALCSAYSAWFRLHVSQL